MFKTGDLYLKNWSSEAHVVVNQGGTSSGKTYAILQVLFVLACDKGKEVITVVGQDIPNLKAGALRDALTIYNGSKELQSLIATYNKSDRTFRFKNGSMMEFKSYADTQDAKSGKRTYLFVNEANGITYDVYKELYLRTTKKVFLDYNPNARFWVHEKLLGSEGVQLLISDHRHNPFLQDDTRKKIEAIKDEDEELWKVYARGLTGKISGLILTNWTECDSIPEGAKLLAYGLDFGFTNDPTGLIAVYMQDGELWLDELIYQQGLTNPAIAEEFYYLRIPQTEPIVADSAEPKSIAELRALGWKVEPAEKGADSIRNGLDILKRYKMHITRRSKHLRQELLSYKNRVDKITGLFMNEPIDKFNHLIDPLRYVALNKIGFKEPEQSWENFN